MAILQANLQYAMGANMKKIGSSRFSGIPMLEMIISIGVFAVISVFILQLFLSGNTMQSKAKDISKGIILAENAAETIKGSKDLESAIQTLGLEKSNFTIKGEEKDERIADYIEIIEQSTSEAAYITYYNESWQQAEQEAAYGMLLLPKKTEMEYGTIIEADIYIYRRKPYISFQDKEGKELLYSLHIADYKEK